MLTLDNYQHMILRLLVSPKPLKSVNDAQPGPGVGTSSSFEVVVPMIKIFVLNQLGFAFQHQEIKGVENLFELANLVSRRLVDTAY